MAKLHKYDSAKYLTSDEAILAYLQEALDSVDPMMVSHALSVVARSYGARRP